MIDPTPWSRRHDIMCRQDDWILFLDPYKKPIVICHHGLHDVGADRCDDVQKAQKHSQHEQAARSIDTQTSSCKDIKISMDGHNNASQTGSDFFSPNPELVRGATPQSRSSPPRLPTPDLPDIEKSGFWPSSKSFHHYEAVEICGSNGSSSNVVR